MLADCETPGNYEYELPAESYERRFALRQEYSTF
jgi:hypothetical protein